ncbi:MAG TPA: serine/threonine-protein kinase, partial [Gemmataceae bacterium]|nr:serine/threonine-protein kinase [Gemmataceae bacterium]
MLPPSRDSHDTAPPGPRAADSTNETATLPPTAAPTEAVTLAPPAAPAAVERVLVPGYEIVSELGRGGMGVVYKAKQRALNRMVALKMVLAGGHAGAADLARFRTEAEAIARLQHPNIVQVHEVGEHDGKPFFSLEFCAGGALDRKLDGTPLPPDEAAALVETLARAMQAAHEKGVIHRDLKPANVLLQEAPQGVQSLGLGIPKITDFGLAKKLDEASQTQSGAVMGTPSYMAPEQAGGKSAAIGPLCDVYALGAILYECLTGRPPFKAATALDTIMQVVSDDPVPPRALNTRVPPDLQTICLKALRKEARQRYASARELADDLRRFRSGEPVRARPVGRAERAVKWVRRNPVGTALIAAVVLLVAGGTGAAWWAQQQRHTREAEEARRRLAADAGARLAMNEARLLFEQAKAEPLGEAGRYREALAAARRAEELTRPGEASDEVRREAADLVASLAEEAGAARRDRALLAALLEVRGPRGKRRFKRDDRGLMVELAEPGADEQFAAAFRAWGLDVDATPADEAAARLRGRPPAVVAEVIAALDDWAGERQRQAMPRERWQRLADLAASLDDPESRRAGLRALVARGGLARERALGALAVALRPVPVPFDVGPGDDRARLRGL